MRTIPNELVSDFDIWVSDLSVSFASDFVFRISDFDSFCGYTSNFSLLAQIFRRRSRFDETLPHHEVIHELTHAYRT